MLEIALVAPLFLLVAFVLYVGVKFWLSLQSKTGNIDLKLSPFPEKPELIPATFLTQILRNGKYITDQTEVTHFDGMKLKGGMHFSVLRAILHYSTSTGSDVATRPKSLVIKMINGDKSMTLWYKFLLWIKMKWNGFPLLPKSIDELAYRLRGYRIELRFYRTYAKQVAIQVPRCYYNFEDFYNVQFVMILEDLSEFSNGEPNGFNLEESKLILENVAALHAEFWNSPYFKDPPEEKLKPSIWQHGGYWFGNKEMPHGKSLTTSYATVLRNFANLDLQSIAPDNFGKHLDDIVESLTLAVHRLTPRTLIHGDYKISNLFVDSINKRVVTIDWQWMGGGCAATDVAYFIYTSVDTASLDESSKNGRINMHENYPYTKAEMELLKAYHNALLKHGITDYPFDMFEKHYLTNVVYFLVFCIRQKYSNMTNEDILRYKRKKEDGLHLRSIPHIYQLFKRAVSLLKRLEAFLEEENIHWKKYGDDNSDYAKWRTSKRQ